MTEAICSVLEQYGYEETPDALLSVVVETYHHCILSVISIYTNILLQQKRVS